MGTVEDQIKEARSQRANMGAPSKSSDDDKNGIQFGTGVAYDDAYGAESNGGGGDYVSSLPTLDEERRMMMDDDENNEGRLAEMEDAGRVGSHPSTLAASNVSFLEQQQQIIHSVSHDRIIYLTHIAHLHI